MDDAQAIDARLDRIRRRVALLAEADRENRPYARLVFGADTHAYRLSGGLDENVVAAYERTRGVSLPIEYRAWLTRMSDGGAGPYYGLKTLAEADEARQLMPQNHVVVHGEDGEELARAGTSPRPVLDRPSDVARAFPFEASWSPLQEGFSLPDDANPYDGTLVLADQGCGMLSLLVVTGPRRGEVWSDSTASEGGFDPEAPSFLDWVERWLDHALVEWVEKAIPRLALDAPLPAVVAEALPLIEANTVHGREESWAALAHLHARAGRIDDALAAADAMARVARAEPERRRAVVRAAIYRAAGDVDRWLEEAERGLAIEQGWASSEIALHRERVAAMRAKKHPHLDAAIEDLAETDIWSMDSQLACARVRAGRGDVKSAIQKIDEALKKNAQDFTSRVEGLEQTFLVVAADLERDGHADAATALRAAHDSRRAKAEPRG